MKRKPTVWKNIFTNGISDKGLISKVDKEFTQLNTGKGVQSYIELVQAGGGGEEGRMGTFVIL